MKMILNFQSREQCDRAIAAVCHVGRRPAKVRGANGELVDNPVSPGDFAAAHIAKTIGSMMLKYDDDMRRQAILSNAESIRVEFVDKPDTPRNQ